MINNKQKSPLEKFLGIFTQVNPGEGASAILLMVNIFLILTSYYIMKPVREALILSGGIGGISGAVIKSYAAAGQVILLMGAVPLYSFIASRVPRRKLNIIVTIFFTACLGIFYSLALLDVPIGIIFFLWIGIFNLMVPAQFWAFANDVYTPEAGKRIFVIIAFGASAGAVLGGIITDILIEPLGVYQLLLVAGTFLLLSLILTNIVDSREKTAPKAQTLKREVEEPFKKGGAFKLVFQSRYLLMIAFLMMILNWVNTTGGFILDQTVESDAKIRMNEPEIKKDAENFAIEQLKTDNPDNEDMKSASSIEELEERYREKAQEYMEEYSNNYVTQYIGNFYAKFYTVINLVGLFMQLFLVSRILKYFGVRIALLILPFIALGGYFLMAFYPVLAIIRWAKTAENSTDYSLQNTVRQVLFLPTTREQKYKAKQAIDTFFWRAGDFASTILVVVGTTWLAFQTKDFAIVNICLVVIWIVLAVFIGRENTRLTSAKENVSE